MWHRIIEWKKEIIHHKTLLIISAIFLVIANVLNQLAGVYADKKGSAVASDLILDHIPAINLSFLLTYGAIIIALILFLYPLFFEVRKLHVVIGQFSLLLIIRSFFIILTHLKMPADAIIANVPRIYDFINFNNDLFFSGHTAFAFLGFLIFRKQKIGIFFLFATVLMAITVLFMHLHYSIDVFAAIFIAYGSYKIGQWIFSKVDHN